MPKRKPYDHAIDFEKEASLPKLAKLYPLSPKEKISLDEWIMLGHLKSRTTQALLQKKQGRIMIVYID